MGTERDGEERGREEEGGGEFAKELGKGHSE